MFRWPDGNLAALVTGVDDVLPGPSSNFADNIGSMRFVYGTQYEIASVSHSLLSE